VKYRRTASTTIRTQNGYIHDVFGVDTANRDSDPMDDHGLGTHIAGTIAAAGNTAWEQPV
jgi:subtilisin family serine protease